MSLLNANALINAPINAASRLENSTGVAAQPMSAAGGSVGFPSYAPAVRNVFQGIAQSMPQGMPHASRGPGHGGGLLNINVPFNMPVNIGNRATNTSGGGAPAAQSQVPGVPLPQAQSQLSAPGSGECVPRHHHSQPGHHHSLCHDAGQPTRTPAVAAEASLPSGGNNAFQSIVQRLL